MNDLKRMQDESLQNQVQAAPSGDSLFVWEAIIFGPDETIWEDGVFRLDLRFSDDYPNRPPKVKFLTKMFHPNIYTNGQICLDILAHQWSPVYDVSSILTSIQSLLCDPNPNSPANAEASHMYQNNYQEYETRVRQAVE